MGACTFARAVGSLGSLSDGETFDDVYRNKRVVRGTLTFSASYATGGDTIPLTAVGLREVSRILVDSNLGINDSGLSIVVGGTPQAPTLVAYDAQGTQVANATNLSGRTAIPVWILGF